MIPIADMAAWRERFRVLNVFDQDIVGLNAMMRGEIPVVRVHLADGTIEDMDFSGQKLLKGDA